MDRGDWNGEREHRHLARSGHGRSDTTDLGRRNREALGAGCRGAGRRQGLAGPGRRQGAGETARRAEARAEGGGGVAVVRRLLIAVAVSVLAGVSVAGDRSSGVCIYTAPDGTRHVLKVPAAGSYAGAVPNGLAARREQLWPTVQEGARTNGPAPTL